MSGQQMKASEINSNKSIYSLSSNFHYIALFADINECTDGSNGGCDQSCSNLEGSFSCNCSEGYKLAGDDRRCLGGPEALYAEAIV